jgi:hypothetical protein
MLCFIDRRQQMRLITGIESNFCHFVAAISKTHFLAIDDGKARIDEAGDQWRAHQTGRSASLAAEQFCFWSSEHKAQLADSACGQP